MKRKFIIPVSCLILLSLCGCVSTLIGEKTALSCISAEDRHI